jgi:hypothetical protein
MSVQPTSAPQAQPSIPKDPAVVAAQAHHEVIETAAYYLADLNEKPPQWLTVTAEHEGRQVQGLYALDGQMLIVSYGIHSKTTQLGGMKAPTLALVLLLELAREGKPLYGATTQSLQASPHPERAKKLAS